MSTTPKAASEAAPKPDDGLWSPSRRGLTVGLVLTITLVAFEALAIATIMPLVSRDLGGLELYGWVFTAFFLGTLLGIAIVGGVIDERGLALPLAIGLLLFAAGLVAGGLAPTMEILVVARFVQGLGGGAVPPIAYVAIGRTLPERLRPGMFATLSTAWVVPGIAGPAIAGSIAELSNWRFVFLGLLPLIALSGAMALRSLPPTAGRGTDEAIDGAGRRRIGDAVLVVVGAGLLTAGLTSDSPPILVILVLVGLGLLMPAMLRLTPPGTFRLVRGVPTAVLLRGLLTCAFFTVDAYISLALVDVRGLTVTGAGLALTAATVSWTAGSWTQARLSRRIGLERLARIGFGVVAVGIVLTALVLHPSVAVWFAVPAFALTGYGMGLSYSQFALIVLRDVAHRAHGTTTAGLSLSDALGTALGTGVAGAIIAAAPRYGLPLAGGLAIAFGLGAVLAGLGFALAPRLRTT
ncbi:MAG: MFS transporter [Chloroflexi bacterium]|nr:MFS transporter [Chloroflexota bacterium]